MFSWLATPLIWLPPWQTLLSFTCALLTCKLALAWPQSTCTPTHELAWLRCSPEQEMACSEEKRALEPTFRVRAAASAHARRNQRPRQLPSAV